MKIAIDISPLQTGHKVRGVGFYLEHLKKALLDSYPENNYQFFLKKAEIKNNTDLVHYPYFDPFSLTLPLQKIYKTVVTVHDLTPLVFPKHFPAGFKGSVRWLLQRFNLQRVDGIISDSFSSKKDIMRLTNILDKKIDVAYLAADNVYKKQDIKEKKENLIQKYNLPEKFVLYVGDVTWNKNLPRLLKAIKKCNLPLVMVGKALIDTSYDRENPWNKDLVEVQALAKGDKNIIRVGFVSTEELVVFYNLATVFVMPSVYEGFGLPLIEAMQSGCPVITTQEGSLKEVAGEAAYFVDGYEVDSLIHGITEVFHSRTLQKELSLKGFEQAKKFSWKKTATETMNIYKKVLSSK